MRELAKDAREHREAEKERQRKAMRDAKLRRVQEEEGKAEDQRTSGVSRI